MTEHVKSFLNFKDLYQIRNERKSKQAHIPHAPTLFENAAHKECQCYALVMGNGTENHNHILVIIGHTLSMKNCNILWYKDVHCQKHFQTASLSFTFMYTC